MGVYVDDMAASFRRMIMCHMVADTTEELLAMADMIGVDRKWIQHAGTHREHFDIAKGKRALAIRCGAKEIDARRMGEFLLKRRRVLTKEEGYGESASRDQGVSGT